jgi:hypothetical protein
MQWLQDPNQSNADNLNNGRCGSSRHFSLGVGEEIISERLKQAVKNKVLETCIGTLSISERLPA